MRTSGILFPIFSLPSPYGIGCFSKEAYDFVDYLKECGQSYWQILPLGPTGYGDSPYQSFSTFAGNPYFIDLTALIEEGLLTKKECESADLGNDEKSIDYYKLYKNRWPLLRKAYDRYDKEGDSEFRKFQEEQAYWLKDYALFMAVKDRFEGVEWRKWADDIRFRHKNAMEYYQTEEYFNVEFYQFVQYLFFKQWYKLKAYANQQGIKIIGDIPIYVSPDSSDAWANPELFQMDNEGNFARVAGCPPDGFAAEGQLWGNPLYRWDYHRQTGYEWWVRRLAACYNMYDGVRIDHFRGFDEYYSIPAGDKNAVNGVWVKGPGIDLFNTIKYRLGDDKMIIAEDLGYMTETVKKLVDDTGYPGMKVIEFAFDERDSSGPVAYLPHNYIENCAAYTGTHDNETLAQWIAGISKRELSKVKKYIGIETDDYDAICDGLIRVLQMSVAKYCIIPLQDYLKFGKEARINTPSTQGGNWVWRIDKKYFTKKNAKYIRDFAETYGRIKVEEKL